MKDLRNRVAAITGAASGIGRALAIQLAEEGCHLALSDVDEVGLAETVTRCEGSGVKVTAQRVDVADRAAMVAWADRVVADHGRVHVIINNAGVALAADVEQMTDDDLDWLLGINLGGVLNGTRAFLPHLRATGEGHVVNLSSVFGLISVPSQSAYNTAKFGVRGFTDALRMELEIAGGGVSCTTVHPGGVRTNIARSARGAEEMAADFDRIARTSAESAAAQIIRAVKRNRRRVLVGRDAKVIDLVSRLPATLYQRPVVLGARLARRSLRSGGDPARGGRARAQR